MELYLLSGSFVIEFIYLFVISSCRILSVYLYYCMGERLTGRLKESPKSDKGTRRALTPFTYPRKVKLESSKAY